MNIIVALVLLALGGIAYTVTVSVLEKRFGGQHAGASSIAYQVRRKDISSGKIDAFGRKLGKAFSKKRTRSTAEMLQQAGLGLTVESYRLLSVVTCVIGVLVGFVVNNLAQTDFLRGVLISVAFGTAGLAVMPLYARNRRKKRQEMIEASLPATLEMLAVVVEAGQSIERGIKTVGQRGKGPLAEEFARADAGVANYGFSAEEALRKMGERVGVAGVSRFVAAVCQSIDAGSSIAPVLKAQARIASDNYYLYIQEKANKLPVKIVLISALFVLPLTMIVTLVPMVITLLETTSGILG